MNRILFGLSLTVTVAVALCLGWLYMWLLDRKACRGKRTLLKTCFCVGCAALYGGGIGILSLANILLLNYWTP